MAFGVLSFLGVLRDVGLTSAFLIEICAKLFSKTSVPKM